MAVNVFTAMLTQWHVGMGGATGLDYGSLPVVMRFIGVPKSQQMQVFEDIRVMEDAALEQMRKDSK